MSAEQTRDTTVPATPGCEQRVGHSRRLTIPDPPHADGGTMGMTEIEAARSAVEQLGDCPAPPQMPECPTQQEADAICAEYAKRCAAWGAAKSAALMALARAQWRETEAQGLWEHT